MEKRMTNPFKIKTPNLKNRRTRKRIYNALMFAQSMLHAEHPAPLSRYELDREFSQAVTATGRWLRYHLLITHDNTWNHFQGKCKEYLLNVDGVKLLRELLEIDKPYNAFSGLTNRDNYKYLDTQLAVDWANERYPFDEITYNEKSNRYWNAIQNLRREIRNEYLKSNGLKYQYDMVCAAQTLLYQRYYQMTGKSLDMIIDYITNRDNIRERLSRELDLPIDSIKKLLTALFAGARVVASNHNDIYEICEYDNARIEWINQDVYMNMLRNEIKVLWKTLRNEIDYTGRITSSIKWKYYFSLERQVMDVIINHVKDKKHFILHDAIVVEQELDVSQIKSQIKSTTGFTIQLEESKFK